jgi:hypothetical protein
MSSQDKTPAWASTDVAALSETPVSHVSAMMNGTSAARGKDAAL